MIVETEILGRSLRYRPLTARTPDGLAISVQDHDRGSGGRDILFIHGYSQASLAWLKQVTGPLADKHRLITYDMRGHGASDKPDEPIFYRDPRRWAAEVQAVIDAAGLDRPAIVCWSYGGRVALDYLAEPGAAAISALVMVAATCTESSAACGPAAPLLRSMADADDLALNIAATTALLRASIAVPLPADEFALMLAYNLLTPPAVRLALTGRPAAYDTVLASLACPLLTIHGSRDAINVPAMSEHAARLAPKSRSVIYEGIGHLPFWEAPERFDAELDAFLSTLEFADIDAHSRQWSRT